MNSPFPLYTIYGGIFKSQEAAQEATKKFVESKKYELYEDPKLMFLEEGKYKLRIIARPI